MRERYGTTARDLFKMSWREFRVLFEALISREIISFGDGFDRDDSAPDGNKFDVIEDWNAVTGKQPDAMSKGTTSFNDYMSRNNLKRTILDGE
jgi:hypothetical protein